MKKILLSLFLLSASVSIAQTSDWKYFSKASNINCFAQEGNDLWIGSFAGIVKMNMLTGVKTFYDKSNCAIPDNWVNKIVVDHNGLKWFAMAGSGIVSFNGTTWTLYDTPATGIPYMSATSMAVTDDNTLWASTSYTSGGLIKFDGTTWTNFTTSNSGIPSNTIQCICTDGNAVWLSSYTGLTKFDGSAWTTYTTSNSTISASPAVEMQTDRAGNLWMAHYGSLEKFDGSTFTLYPNPPLLSNYSIAIDTNNVIWTGCLGSSAPPALGGVLSFDGSTWTKYDTANSPVSDTYMTVYADASNNIWMGGTTVDALDKKSGSAWTSYDISASPLNDRNVRDVAFDQNGAAFIGTFPSAFSGESFMKFDWTSWSQGPYYNGHKSYGVEADKNGNIYVKDPSGLYRYNGSSWITVPGTPPLGSTMPPIYLNLNCMAADSSGGIWMDYLSFISTTVDSMTGSTSYSGHEGLAHYNGSTWTLYDELNSPLPGGNILLIRTDRNNNVWIGGNGLTKFDGTTWTHYNASNSCVPNSVTTFAVDTAGNTWYSDNHYGMIKFDGTACTPYPHPVLGAYSASASAFALDIDGTIWQMTSQDLIHFDGTNWTTFNATNSPIAGATNPTAIAIDKSGNKWLSTSNGLFVYKEGGVSVVSVPTLAKTGAPASAFPNPFRDAFEIRLGKSYDRIELKLTDLLSREVYRTSKDNVQVITVPRNGLPAGVYLYQLRSGDKLIANGKIIAE